MLGLLKPYRSDLLKNKTLFLLGACLSFWGLNLRAQNIPKIGKDFTLEIANWNLEWFGKISSGFGPSDDAKQQALVLKTIQKSDLDIWGFCEVSEQKAFDSMMVKLPNYAAVLANYFPEQKTALLYKKSMFELIDFKLLATNNKDSFSTYRFPLEVRLKPMQNIGIDTLRLILIHLKANTGTDSAKMIAYNSRKHSAEWLKMYLNTLNPDEFTLLMGDWNDDIDVSIYNNLPSPFVKLLNTGFKYQFLSKKLSDLGLGSTCNYPETIDHQLASNGLALKHQTDSTFVWRLDTYISNYATECSDHYPVYSIFNTYGTNILFDQDDFALSIHPNPASHSLNIQTNENTEVKIFNSMGELVYHTNTNHALSIDIHTWAKGLYFLRTVQNKKTLDTKLLLE